MPKKYNMNDMSWPEIAESLKENDVVLVPVGSTEEHGLHLPISTDSLIPIELCKILAEKLGALVGPPIYTGVSPYHMPWPGTITLKENTLIELIKDYCTSLAAHGFKKIILVSEHGGNLPAVKVATRQLTTELHPVKIIPIEPTDFLDKNEFSKYYGLSGGAHANAYETATILSIRPDLVNMEKAAAEWPKKFIDAMEKGMDHMLFIKLLITTVKTNKELTESGTFGDPTKAHELVDVKNGAQMQRSCERMLKVLEQIL